LRDISLTTLRSSTAGNTSTDSTQLRLLEPSTGVAGQTETFQRFELFSKILGNVTTRSNVFGVWLTIGYFQVTDDTKQPAQLGQEYIWPSSQSVIRHKYFAIIDRSQLQVWPTTDDMGRPKVRSAVTISVTAPATSTSVAVSLVDGGTPPQAITATNPVTNPNTNRSWTPGWLQTPAIGGTVLTFDPDTNNEETVVVDATGNATFYKSHLQYCTVISRGNPGPWTLYDPTKDPAVVPYAAKIN
jgi:hypothetical protein